MIKRTKIVCTLGPSSTEVETLVKLIEAGMNVARFNFSHGSYEEHMERITNLREAAARTGKPIGFLMDIQGPKIRTGKVEGGRVTLKEGENLVLTTQEVLGTSQRVTVSYPPLTRDLKPGNTVFIDDAMIELRVLEIQGTEVTCQVVVGGELSNRKGVSLPGVDVDLPSITEKDIADIRFGIEQGFDFIAASFVRRAQGIFDIQEILRQAGADIDVIAKIESEEGIRNLQEIIKAADGVMVARGDLGVETPPEELPLIQKSIIRQCNQLGKPVITATQMLESMKRNPRPTRAEVTDVANAILDGTDAVMLSGETAVGDYPVTTVRVMATICSRIEHSMDYAEILYAKRIMENPSVADAISHATCQSAEDLKVSAIISSTQSGSTARMVSKYRPRAPIFAVTPAESVRRKLSLTWGVLPLRIPVTNNIDDMIDMSVQAAKSTGLISDGELVVITAGVKTGLPGSTNLLKVHRI